MIFILDPGPRIGMLLLAGHLLPFKKCLLANRQVVSVLPDLEEFLVLFARPRVVAQAIEDATKLKAGHDPIRWERILENFTAVVKDLPPSRRCLIPIPLSLIGACQTLIRCKARILRRSCRERLDRRVDSAIRQSNFSS